jgi:hypothetical protein
VDIDAMALPLPPVAVSVPKRESVKEVMVVDVMLQRSVEAQQARQIHSDGQCVLVDLLSNLNPVHIYSKRIYLVSISSPSNLDTLAWNPL